MGRVYKILGKEVFSVTDPEGSKVIKPKNKQLFYGGSIGQTTGPISKEQLRKNVLREPLIRKAIWKKNEDTFRNWFILKPEDGSDNISSRVQNIVKKFNKRVNFPYKLLVAAISANIYGTGFIERTFIEQDSIKQDDKVNFKRKPLNLNSLNSEFIIERGYKNDKDKTLYWIYKEKSTVPTEKIFIHPDRILDIKIDWLPFSHFGISVAEVASNILYSKMNSDESAGRILNWFGHGILDMSIENMTENQLKEMQKVFKQHPDYYVHDQDFSLDVKNPTRIDPGPFYDFFYTNIAAALKMPKHMLTGAELGTTAGFSVGMSDYYHDIENIQKLIFTPIVEKVYRQLIESNGLSWKYDIKWNPIFVDELSEAKISQTRTFSAVQNKNAGIIDIPEARKILNDGIIELDPNKKIEDKEEQPELPISEPNIEPQPTVKKPSIKSKIIPLNEAQQKMIDKWRDYCRKELAEQEKRLKEAEEKIKNAKK